MAGTENKRSRGAMIHMLLTSPNAHLNYISSHLSPSDEVSYNSKQNKNQTEQRNINFKSTTKVPFLVDKHSDCSTPSKLTQCRQLDFLGDLKSQQLGLGWVW